jgi:hypothetical protein
MSRGLPHTGQILHIKDANGNLEQHVPSKAVYAGLAMTFLGGDSIIVDYPSKSDRYNGSIVNNSTNSTVIGSFTDTIHAADPGQPVTTITSTTTALHQLDDTITAPTLVPLSADSDGQLYAMNDEELAFANTFFGFSLDAGTLSGFTFRLASSTPEPTGDWEVWESAIFTNTEKLESNVVYNIYRRISAGDTSFSGFYDNAYGTSVVYKTINSKPAVQQMSDIEVGRAFVYASQLLRAETGVGDYILAASGDTLPSGTWKNMGSALDTRRTLANEDFVGQREVANPFVGSRTLFSYFIGHRGTEGENTEQFANAEGQKFAGTRQFGGNRESAQQFFSGSRDYQFAGITPHPTTSLDIETYTLYLRTAA